jgi:hypothetical protein
MLGVSLLHRHFSISSKEIVVKEFDNNVAIIKPREMGNVTGVLPYIWRVEVEGNTASFYPTEFCAFPENLQGFARAEIEIVGRSDRFLAEFAQKLSELELTDVFGIVSLCSRQALEIDEGWTLLESSDAETRTLILKPVRESELEELEPSTQTLWAFSPPEANSEVSVEIRCGAHCFSHCYEHPVTQ